MKFRPSSARAFTLVEVILAILIISGIMTVLLFFYQRAAQVRQAAMEEAEFLSISRMLLDQITAELRAARNVEDQFAWLEGASNSLSFACTAVPRSARWISSTNDPIVLPPATDLRRVAYRLVTSTNTAAPGGITRTEEMLLGPGLTAGTNATEFINPAETNLTAEASAELPAASAAAARSLLTDRIRFLQFRYWSGTNWVDSWSDFDLPGGVEISIGRDPLPPEAGSEGYPFELFRRAVYLPNSPPPANQINLAPVEMLVLSNPVPPPLLRASRLQSN